MKRASVLFVSGAPKGATKGQQRYECFWRALQNFSPTIGDVYFACPFSFPADTMPDYADVIVLGFPVATDFKLPPHQLLIYDICDIWWVEGWHVNLAEQHKFWLDKCDIVTVVSDYLAYEIVKQTSKPLYIIPNATSFFNPETFKIRPLPSDDFKVGYFFVGSHYNGQNWWALTELAAVAHMKPDNPFYFFLATDRINPLGVMPFHLPPNVKVLATNEGIDWKDVLQVLDSEPNVFWIGLIPYKPHPIGYAASPIKAYDYLAFGFPVIAWNNSEVTKISPYLTEVIWGEVLERLPEFHTATMSLIAAVCYAALEQHKPNIPTWGDRAIGDLWGKVIVPNLRRRQL